jgi:hypothetical protein
MIFPISTSEVVGMSQGCFQRALDQLKKTPAGSPFVSMETLGFIVIRWALFPEHWETREYSKSGNYKCCGSQREEVQPAGCLGRNSSVSVYLHVYFLLSYFLI